MKKVRLLFFIHYFVGIGALFGGMGAILNPREALGITASDALRHAPFDDFLIPGIFLFTVLGLGNIFGALIAHIKKDYLVYTSGVLGLTLFLWIIIQCYMLHALHILHIIFFLIGILQSVLALNILNKRRKLG